MIYSEISMQIAETQSQMLFKGGLPIAAKYTEYRLISGFIPRVEICPFLINWIFISYKNYYFISVMKGTAFKNWSIHVKAATIKSSFLR